MINTFRDLIKRLADALHEAAGEVEGWGNYASSYFQEKHDLQGNVARIYAEAAEARAAILRVAAWLDRVDLHIAATRLRMEAQ